MAMQHLPLQVVVCVGAITCLACYRYGHRDLIYHAWWLEACRLSSETSNCLHSAPYSMVDKQLLLRRSIHG